MVIQIAILAILGIKLRATHRKTVPRIVRWKVCLLRTGKPHMESQLTVLACRLDTKQATMSAAALTSWTTQRITRCLDCSTVSSRLMWMFQSCLAVSTAHFTFPKCRLMGDRRSFLATMQERSLVLAIAMLSVPMTSSSSTVSRTLLNGTRHQQWESMARVVRRWIFGKPTVKLLRTPLILAASTAPNAARTKKIVARAAFVTGQAVI